MTEKLPHPVAPSKERAPGVKPTAHGPIADQSVRDMEAKLSTPLEHGAIGAIGGAAIGAFFGTFIEPVGGTITGAKMGAEVGGAFGILEGSRNLNNSLPQSPQKKGPGLYK